MVSERTTMESEIPPSSSHTSPADNPLPNTDNPPLQFTVSSSVFTNPASPFYLPHGESPGAILVSQQLVGENYNTWSRSMTMALTAKNKLAFVDGSLPQPAIDTGAEFQAWVRCNNMILSWILNSVSKEIAASVIYIDTCHGMWLDLKERFSQKNGPRVFQLQKSISALSQGDSSVSSYFTQLKSLWDELSNYRSIPPCSCGSMKVVAELFHQEYIYHFLMGLNESFASIRGQILLMEPLPSVNKVFSLVTQEEKQQEISVKSQIFGQESTALLANSSIPASRFTKQPYRKEKPICTHCGVPGHIADKCYRLHGFPPGFKFTKNIKKSAPSHSANHVQEADINSVSSTDSLHAVPQLPITPDQCQQLLSFLQQQSLVQQPSAHMAGSMRASSSAPVSTSSQVSGYTSIFSNLDFKYSVFSATCLVKSPHLNPNCTSWIIDTGATDHMINCPSLFTTITAVVSSFVKLPNGSVVPVTHIGTVVISESLILTEVLCVPSFTFNLISASKLTKFLKVCLIFLAGFCFIQTLCTWRTIGVGKEEGGLFYLQQPKVLSFSSAASTVASSLSVCLNSIKNSISDVWHYRLGHPSASRMQFLHNNVPDISCNSKDICSICPLARQHRLPFPVHTTTSCMPFDLVHCDIWGPIAHTSINGSVFFLTIVDDFTRFTWVHLMKHKSQTRSLVQSFFSFVQTQFSLTIKCIRTDNGPEFKMDNFFSTHGNTNIC
jgi:hypothetical protein